MIPPWRRRPDSPPRPQPFVLTRREPPVGEREPPAASEEFADGLLAGRFVGASEALTFIGAVHDPGNPDPPRCLRSGDGALWVLRTRSQPSESELVWVAGGTPYRVVDGQLVSSTGRRTTRAEMRNWTEVSWIELAACIPLAEDGAVQREIVVVTTASIARWAVNRYHDAAVEMRFASATLAPVFHRSEDWQAILLRITGSGRDLSRSILHSLARMPFTIVCRSGDDRLLVEHRARPPLSDGDLAAQVQPGESWILGGPDQGVWRITGRSAEVEPPFRPVATLMPPRPAVGRLPSDLSVTMTLVRESEIGDGPDAILVTDADLRALPSFLTGSPSAEKAFLILGDGFHLLAEPGGRIGDLPFGVPLRSAGVAGFFVESGYCLRPSIPPAAAARVFGLDGESVVIMCSDGAHRLAVSSTVPVWALWLGDTPQVAVAEPTGAIEAILTRFDALDMPRPDSSPPDTIGAREATQVADLRAEAFVLEQQGRYADAARRYREAGAPHLAGRMYELAAKEQW